MTPTSNDSVNGGSGRNETVARDDLPQEVYAAHADFVRLAMKTMTARRMIGWLREYAEYCDVGGSTTTADHARHMANTLAREVEPESVECDSTDTDNNRVDCPEYGCGISFPDFEQVVTHLQWDHNRSQLKAERMVRRSLQSDTALTEGDYS